jgi:hypothetical protein
MVTYRRSQTAPRTPGACTHPASGYPRPARPYTGSARGTWIYARDVYVIECASVSTSCFDSQFRVCILATRFGEDRSRGTTSRGRKYVGAFPNRRASSGQGASFHRSCRRRVRTEGSVDQHPSTRCPRYSWRLGRPGPARLTTGAGTPSGPPPGLSRPRPCRRSRQKTKSPAGGFVFLLQGSHCPAFRCALRGKRHRSPRLRVFTMLAYDRVVNITRLAMW